MKLQTPILNGVTLVNVLKNLYPDIRFDIQSDVRLPGRVTVPQATTIFMWKKCPDGKKAGITLSMNPDFLENASSEILKDSIENAVRKLREYCANYPSLSKENNPSSRWYA